MLIDSHCHLEYEGLADRQDEVLANARAAGVQGFLNISTRRSEWERVVGTATRVFRSRMRVALPVTLRR